MPALKGAVTKRRKEPEVSPLPQLKTTDEPVVFVYSMRENRQPPRQRVSHI